MLGDVEQDAFGAVELDIEAANPLRDGLVHVVLAAERLELLRGLVDILDQDAEMVQPGVIHALADLLGLEAKNRKSDSAFADVMAVGDRTVAAAHHLEVEDLDIAIGHRVRVFAGDGDVAQLGHGCPPYSAAALVGTGSGSAPAQPCSAMSNKTPSGPKNFFSK